MFDTFNRELNFRDQGSGLPPWDDDDLPEEDWSDQTPPHERTQGDDLPQDGPDGGPPSEIPPEEELDEREQELLDIFGQPVDSEQGTIEDRTSEAEKLYANLLMRTDFDREFIEEMLEIDELSEEQEMRIDELRRKRREVENMMPQGGIPPASPQGPTTILI